MGNFTLYRPTNTWDLQLQAEETADDSDKLFTVPAGRIWQVMWIWIELTSTATVGDRQIEVLIRDSADDTVMQLQAGVTQAASLTYNYLFAPGMPDLGALRDSTYLTTPLPPTLILPAAYDIRIYDNNAVAAAADDMIIQMMIGEQSH